MGPRAGRNVVEKTKSSLPLTGIETQVVQKKHCLFKAPRLSRYLAARGCRGNGALVELQYEGTMKHWQKIPSLCLFVAGL